MYVFSDLTVTFRFRILEVFRLISPTGMLRGVDRMLGSAMRGEVGVGVGAYVFFF